MHSLECILWTSMAGAPLAKRIESPLEARIMVGSCRTCGCGRGVRMWWQRLGGAREEGYGYPMGMGGGVHDTGKTSVELLAHRAVGP